MLFVKKFSFSLECVKLASCFAKAKPWSAGVLSSCEVTSEHWRFCSSSVVLSLRGGSPPSTALFFHAWKRLAGLGIIYDYSRITGVLVFRATAHSNFSFHFLYALQPCYLRETSCLHLFSAFFSIFQMARLSLYDRKLSKTEMICALLSDGRLHSWLLLSPLMALVSLNDRKLSKDMMLSALLSDGMLLSSSGRMDLEWENVFYCFRVFIMPQKVFCPDFCAFIILYTTLVATGFFPLLLWRLLHWVLAVFFFLFFQNKLIYIRIYICLHIFHLFCATYHFFLTK